MENVIVAQTDYFALLVVPLLIFLARILDVSIGTIRIIFVAKGYRFLAPVLGFMEVFIWLLAMREIFKNIDEPINIIAYCLGFAMGNYTGILIENKLAIGRVLIRIITQKDAFNLIEKMKEQGYPLTTMLAEGLYGPVNILFTVINRKDISIVVEMIKQFNPRAFYTIEEVGFVSNGYVPIRTRKKEHDKRSLKRK